MNLNGSQMPAAKAISIAGSGRSNSNPFFALARGFGSYHAAKANLQLHVQKQMLTAAIGAAGEHEKFAARVTGTHAGLQDVGWDENNPLKSVGPQGVVFQSTFDPYRSKKSNEERTEPNPGDTPFSEGIKPEKGFHGPTEPDPTIEPPARKITKF